MSADEISRAAPKRAELESLEDEAKRLGHAEELGRTAMNWPTCSAAMISPRRTCWGRSGGCSAPWSASTSGAVPAGARCSTPRCSTSQELERAVRDYAGSLELDPARLATVEGRRDALFRLDQKYGPGIEQVLAAGAEARAELDLLDTADGDLQDLSARIAQAERDFQERCKALGAKRRSAAKRLGAAVSKHLTGLGMPDGVLRAALEPLDTPGRNGAESIEFLCALNPGMGERPVARAASGGELSRLMLALKVELARHDRVPTLVFDEVDAGIGGHVADRVAEALARVAEGHQVLVITHLPQIAAAGARHHVVAEGFGGRHRPGGCADRVRRGPRRGDRQDDGWLAGDGAAARPGAAQGGRSANLKPVCLVCLVCFCLSLSVSALPAQVRGRVLDPTDRPVPEALVELWGPGGRIAATNTDENGAFVFATNARPPLAVFARKIGYLPTRIAVTFGQPVEIRLRRREQMLAALTVTANNIRCVTRNDGDGRRLWEAARRQYGPPPMVVVAFPGGRQLTISLRGDGRTHTAFVPNDSLGVLDTSALRENSTWRLGMPTAALDNGPSRFYASANVNGAGGRFDRYQYPLLDSYQAFHFTDSLFGEWNRLGSPVLDRGNLVVEFCSRHDRGQPFITGTLTFTPESTLASARWGLRDAGRDGGRIGLVYAAFDGGTAAAAGGDRTLLAPPRARRLPAMDAVRSVVCLPAGGWAVPGPAGHRRGVR